MPFYVFQWYGQRVQSTSFENDDLTKFVDRFDPLTNVPGEICNR